MQYQVPQFIDIEDRIIGPLTLKQFMLSLGAALLLLTLWYFFKLWCVIAIGLPLAGFLILIIFVKINGRPFFDYVISFFSYITRPRIYVWRRKDKDDSKF